jgi:DNA-binding IclR family transcriptional regulator
VRSNSNDELPEGTSLKEDRQFVTALARGLEVLRCFSPARPELGTTDIARITKLPQSTVWRLCHTMVRLGFLRVSSNGEGLQLGIPVLSLGFAVLANMEIGEVALPYMQELAEKYQGAVSLGARDGVDMIYLQRVQGSFIILPHLRIGSRVSMATSATGWAYLAGLDPAARQNMQKELKKASGAEWGRHEEQLETALREYEQVGYIVNKGVLHNQINSVAVPIIAPGSSELYTLSSGGINVMFTDAKLHEIGEELKKLAVNLAPVVVGKANNRVDR